MKTNLHNAGYTVVELLAVISILVVTSGIIISILYSTLRTSSKTKITTEVSQSGSYVLSVITNEVRSSRNVSMIDEVPIQDCVAASPSPPPSGQSITFKKIEGSQKTFACEEILDSNDETVYTLTEDGVSLINTSVVQLEPNSCSFTCDQAAGDLYAYPIIRVSFRLKDKSSSGPESQGSALFQTSVSLNNYLP